MPMYTCNHCKKSIKNNGGSAREVGMIEIQVKSRYNYYHYDCVKKIIDCFLEEI